MPPCRVLVIDDQPTVRQVIRLHLAQDARFEVVAEASTAGQAVDRAASHESDAILLDLTRPQASGIDVLPLVRGLRPHARIVMFTQGERHDEDARALGADLLVAKGSTIEQIIDALLGDGPARPTPES